MANQSEAHSKLVNEVLLEIGKRFNGKVRAWKNHTGQAFTPDSVAKAFDYLSKGGVTIEATRMLVPIKFGVVGQADISGIIYPTGRRLEIEVKTGTGKLSEKQKAFRDMIIHMGGLHIELRAVSDLDKIKQLEMLQ
jgi:hypothetical protein